MVVSARLRGRLMDTLSRYRRSGLFILASAAARRVYLPILRGFCYVGRTGMVAVPTDSDRGSVRDLVVM